MPETRQTIEVTVDSETPSCITADRIHRMLRDRFAYSSCISDPMNKDQGFDNRLKGAISNMKHSLVMLIDTLHEETEGLNEDDYKAVRSMFHDKTVSLMDEINELGKMLKMRGQVAEFLKNVHPGMSAGDLIRVVVNNDLKALDDKMVDTMPDELAHSVMHVIGTLKKLETVCDESPANIREWIKKNLKPNPKEMS